MHYRSHGKFSLEHEDNKTTMRVTSLRAKGGQMGQSLINTSVSNVFYI